MAAEPLDELSFSHARLTELGIPTHHTDGRELALWDRITLLIGFEPQSLPVPTGRSRPVQPVAEAILRVALGDAPEHHGRWLSDIAVDYLQRRHEFGVRKYGRRLASWNGRDCGEDAQQEASDLPNYCAQAAMEHADEGDAEGAALWSLLGCEAAVLLGRVIVLRGRKAEWDSGAAQLPIGEVLDRLRVFAEVPAGSKPSWTAMFDGPTGKLFTWSVRQLLFSVAEAFGISHDEPMMPALRERATQLRRLTERADG